VTLRVGVRLPACERADKVAAAAAYAEAAGFDSVWVPDSQLIWRDTFASLALAAVSTRRITLAPGVTNLVTRHVSVVASAARTVQELARGRFVLALGAGRSAAEMIGATSTPTRALEESLNALRTLLSGEAWSFGRVPQRLSGAGGTCPIYLGAAGPRNVQLACAEADGLILTGSLSLAEVTGLAASVRALVAQSSRPDRPFDLVLWMRAHAVDGSARDPRQWKPAVVIAVMNAPPAMADDLGIDPGALGRARGLQSDGTHSAAWAEAVASCDALISDEAAIGFAQRYCLYGTPGDISRRVAALETAGVTTIITTPLAGDTTFSLPYEFMDSLAAAGLIAAAKRPDGPGTVIEEERHE
jgi:5,10-methylenetetrahydromethanopterin reductase